MKLPKMIVIVKRNKTYTTKLVTPMTRFFSKCLTTFLDFVATWWSVGITTLLVMGLAAGVIFGARACKARRDASRHATEQALKLTFQVSALCHLTKEGERGEADVYTCIGGGRQFTCLSKATVQCAPGITALEE